ncbi:MAG: RrF2 family transcriptional regulator [Betaproteobacteria bacterium]
MQVTRAADYAVRVTVHLATLPSGARASRAALARAADAPQTFVAKILQQLVDARIVRSHAGRAGGFELARPADGVSVLDVVTAVEGPLCLNRCVSGNGDGCHLAATCAAQRVWASAQAALTNVLSSASLAQLAGFRATAA